MASTVIGLFEERADADAALKDLTGAGYGRGDIEIKEAGSASNLDHELSGHGVPGGDIKLFMEGLRAGDTLEIAHTSDDRAEMAREIMDRHGALDIHDAYAVRGGQSAAPVAAVGTGLAAGAAATGMAATGTTGTRDVQGETVIPIVEEELEVGKRQIQRGGARIHTRVTERPVEASVTLREEHVSVERHAVDRPVTAGDAAFREQNLQVTETREVPVVAKDARVVEEVTVGKVATEHTETVTDTVRRTEVDVEELDGGVRKS